VNPQLSKALSRLAYNLRWAWHAPTADLFHDLAPAVWDETHNPIEVMRAVGETPGLLRWFAGRIVQLEDDLDEYLRRPPAHPSAPRTAYFSAEFAVTECLPIYSGGLGVLAGDHLKAASDLGVPIIGVGLLYRYGYFRQTIDAAGRQSERYDRLDPANLPLRPVFGVEDIPLEIAVPLPGRDVHLQVWRAQVGRVPLYLLDADIPANREDDRWITAHLYGGDRDTRLRQELVLGIGGARTIEALRVLGLEPAPQVYHLNEGHAAFVAVERAADRMRKVAEETFFVAHQRVAESVVFTTHTPVAAGHDAFTAELIEAYLGAYREQLGLSHTEFMALGRRDVWNKEELFSMTVLALRSAHARNGVSQLHGVVSERMWSGAGVGLDDATPRVEMEAITNGVHTATWAGPEIARFLDVSLGSEWRDRPQDAGVWSSIANVDPSALWAVRSEQRERLLAEIDARLSGTDWRSGRDPLVIGFARRFATYKRAALMLRHPAWLERLVSNPSQPLLFVFAGKAHPQDEPGKELVRRIVEASHDPRYRGSIVFLPDYDVELARLLVQGSDIWLNTPRRPMEASGTSGMKAALNGALNVSELDGWWNEAYAPDLGWALGQHLPASIADDARDEAEAAQLMDLLETQIVPLFFTRDASGVPVEWVTRVQRSIEVLAPMFSAHRMMDEYVARMYQRLASQRHSTRLFALPDTLAA
jgi:starch phosphorylase